jgi:cardiolipin synthase
MIGSPASARRAPGSITARDLADQAFARAAGAPLVPDNCVRILKDAEENYPAWLEVIRSARRTMQFESYISVWCAVSLVIKAHRLRAKFGQNWKT